jgi:aryl-alcohol dehydrogenase-like predicted oxidoreductase
VPAGEGVTILKSPRMTRKDFLKKAGAGLAGIVAADAFGAARPRMPASPDAKTLRTRILGRTGIKSTALGFGAARTMEPTLVRAALDRGITFFDTGRSYFNGNNERMLGGALAGIRTEVIIQSKMKVQPKGDSAEVWSSLRREMEAGLEASLRSLKTDYIDIMLFHDVTDVRILMHESVKEFFAAAKSKGRIRAHGFSFHNEMELLRAANASKFYDIVMTPYNHRGSYVHSVSGSKNAWDQPGVEKELTEAAANGLGVVVMKTCSGGPYALPGGESPSMAAAVKWVIDRPFVGVAIVAMANLEEMDEDLRAGL